MARFRSAFSLADPRLAIGLCAAGLTLFAILSYSAMHGKSATYDETTHSVAGFVHATQGDFRINPEDPALFGYWGALIQSRDDLKIVKDYLSWDGMLKDFATNQWIFSMQTLYQTPGNDGDAFVQRSRLMFTLVGVILGAVITAWTWRLAGATAAVSACAFFCFDPNFAAHSSIYKNDVMLSLMMISLSFALWRFGRRGSVWNLLAIALTAAAAINVKFSGILCGPIILLTLGTRAFLPAPWAICKRVLDYRWQRLVAVVAVCLFVAATCDGFTWACYRFRYPVTTAPGAVLNIDQVVDRARVSKVWAEMGEGHTAQEAFAASADKPVPPIARALVWAMDHRVLPQSWLFGFLFTYATTQVRASYLLGQLHLTGFWYYFPCCFLFKTPTATLAAILLVPAGLLWRRGVSPLPAAGERAEGTAIASRVEIESRATEPKRSSEFGSHLEGEGERFWSLTCLILPVAIYAGSAMSTNLNLGLRHILPIYPFLFVALGCGLAALIHRSGRIGVALSIAVLGGLAVESVAAYPNYLAFFNFPSGGSSGGIDKLGDSNLDWGQDLKGLAEWQKNHNTLPMYLAYFGTASPQFYGVQAVNVPGMMGGWPFDQNPQLPQAPCYFAISATNLQGIYLSDSGVRDAYRKIQASTPVASIGGSIYIYQLPFSEKR